MTPEGIWLLFVFAFGACVGSFLNVVIYRLPLDKSIVSPPSSCPSCGMQIAFYDNIPVISWILLRGHCRGCRAPISIRYPIIELLTAVLFTGIYLWFFVWEYRATELKGDGPIERFFFSGGWLFYVNVMVLTAAFLAASAIDLELWLIPLSLCWFVTAVGFVCSAAAPWIIQTDSTETDAGLFPSVTPVWAGISLGAAAGLAVSLICLRKGWIQASYAEQSEREEKNPDKKEPVFNDRREILKEIVFLAPAAAGGIAGWGILRFPLLMEGWERVSQLPVVSGLMGALAGYLAGAAIVWATRIVGTLIFGREAMGLGDVHLMGAAGAVIGPGWVILAFFVAPFFGLLWALYQWLSRKSRQIPYGPFLSSAVLLVILFHDWILVYLNQFYGLE
ncbi:MAG TPA: prepilin peptidase [Anaerohalosphaeraceae bacterium]|nr:prepilin peptidase [Anaerohalosphaeraceae bacterium]HOL89442.1 prepilin peptidase [Anaerohalosphaeraceae bacterium]HPP56728.1 prepilin peptidase [Anaerohalosphaeraceae bacterium]